MVLHDLLGTGVAAHVLSTIYLWFLPLVPLALTAWLIWSRNISFGYWFATSQCIAWTLGTASYYALPTLGPGFEYSWLYERPRQTPASSQLMDVAVLRPSKACCRTASRAPCSRWPASRACTSRSPCWSR